MINSSCLSLIPESNIILITIDPTNLCNTTYSKAYNPENFHMTFVNSIGRNFQEEFHGELQFF